jgi:hypothetical protein
MGALRRFAATGLSAGDTPPHRQIACDFIAKPWRLRVLTNSSAAKLVAQRGYSTPF